MSQLYFGVITLSIVVGTVFFILVLIELKTAIKALKEFLEVTESTLKPTLEELREYMRVAKDVTENVNTVAEDVKVFSGSVRAIGEDMRSISRSMRFISNLIDEQGSIAAVKISGLRAGIKAGSQIVLKHFFSKKNP
jgi:uncharacterized protein YoxC